MVKVLSLLAQNDQEHVGKKHHQATTINRKPLLSRHKKLVVVLVRGILFLIICLCAASGEPQLARAARWGLAL